ncbi:MAG: DNA polymerase, partial [Bacteroidota bacterium]
MADKKLFLLDALALIYRAHFAFIKNPRINSKGMNTSAVFGFLNSLMQLIEKERATHLAVAYDLSGPTFRHIEYPEYKANREEMPEDIRAAIPMTKKLLNALNIPILEMAGFEADDVIGTIAGKAEKAGYKVYMVTPDKDYAQLVTENVFLYKPARLGNGIEIYNPAKVVEKFGVGPDRIIDFLGLKGDKVDNIPGIPRVGDKTAVALITEFGTVEEIVERAEEITKKSIKASVKEFGQQGIQSKWLATIKTDVPLPWSEEDCKVGDPDRQATIDIMNELEFRTTAKRILASPIFGDQPVQTDLFGNVSGGGGATVAAPSEIESTREKLEDRKHNYIHIQDAAGLKKLVADIKAAGSFCFDTETTGLDPMIAELIAVTISIKPHEAYLIHFPEKDEKSLEQLEVLREVLESKDIIKIAQNLKYDALMLKNYGINISAPIFDTMLAHYILDPDKPHGMDAMALELLNYEPVSITTLIGTKGKGQLSMRQVPLEKLIDYACEDADITLDLKEKLEPKLDESDVRKVLETVEHPLVPVLTDMEFTGVKINEGMLRDYSKELEVELTKVEAEIYELAGMKFNINSPKQLGEIIFDRL